MNLDIFRFIAAFMVVVAHGFEGWHGWFGLPHFMSTGDYKTFSFWGGVLNRGIMNLGFGVDIFFLISGFLITYLLIKEREETNQISLIKFYMRRFLRIWPLYYLLIAIAPFLISWLDEQESPNYLMNILFLNNFHAITTEKWTYPFAHFWSICVEEHFYLFWPLLIKFTPKRHLLNLFYLIIIASIGFKCYVALTNQHAWMTLYLHTFSRMDGLALGSLVGYLHYQKPLKINIPYFSRILIYSLFIFCFFIDNLMNYDDFFLAVFKKFFYLGIVGFAMYNYLFNPDARWKIQKKNFIHYLGKISYGTYMYHNVVILIIIKKILINHNINNIYAYTGILLGSVIIIPIISYEFFEKPFLKLKRKYEVIATRR